MLLAFALPHGAAAAEPCPPHEPASYDAAGSARAQFPSDPLYRRQWALALIKAPAAWARGARGKGAVISTIDSGADYFHPDLREKLLPGFDASEADGQDPADCPPGPQDTNYHGTMMAGIAAADTDNAYGIAGVAPEAMLMPVRFRARSLETEAAQVLKELDAGIRWAADHGADVINLSTVSYRTLDPAWSATLNAAAEYAWSKGAVLTGQGGNNSAPACEQPAKRVVCVVATDRHGRTPTYSNAPTHLGGGITVQGPGGADEGARDGCVNGDFVLSTSLPGAPVLCSAGAAGYDQRSGSSWASAHVAGLAALLAGRGLTNVEIVECLKRTSSNEGTPDALTGYGLVDADRATATCVTGPPDPPMRTLRVRPAVASAGRRVRFRFHAAYVVRGRSIPMSRAAVRFAGRRARTDRNGNATIVATLSKRGRYDAIVARRRGPQGATTVRVRQSRP